MVMLPAPRWRNRNGWCAVLVASTLLPAVGAPPTALMAAVPAALALTAAAPAWPATPLDLRRPHLGLPEVALLTSAVSVLADLVYAGPRPVLLVWLPLELLALSVLVTRVVRHLPGRTMVAVAGLTALAAVLLPLRYVLHFPQPDSAVGAFVASALLFGFPVACAGAVGLWLRTLDQRRLDAVAAARRQQRLEVAHGLHDFLAHELTGIVSEAHRAREQAYDSQGARLLLERIETAGLRALESMDDALRALRGPEGTLEAGSVRLYGPDDIGELVARFEATGGAPPTRVHRPDVLPVLDREVAALAYAIVLEGLTNVRRHAPDARGVDVSIGPGPGHTVEVLVTDQAGASAAGGRADAGTGLIGLGERAAALGGHLWAGPTTDGWELRGLLPGGGPGTPGAVRSVPGSAP